VSRVTGGSPSHPGFLDELHRTLFQHAPIGIGVADLRGNLIVYNDAILTPGGYTRSDVARMGNVGGLYYDPADRAPVLAELAERGGVHRRAVRFRRKDGTPYDTLLSLVPINVGGLPYTLAIVEDVTEQRRLEAQLRQAQKMEAIGQLTGGIAHDLNNLLTVILANAELLVRSVPPDRPDLTAELDEVRAAAESGRDLIRRLLGFSRRQVLDLRPVNLAEEIRRWAALLRRVLPETISLSVTADRPVRRVKADPAAVEQIVMNLVTNARDAMPGGGALTVEVYESEPGARELGERPGLAPGPYVWIRVSDTGTGMSEDVLRRVFEPFFTTKAPGQGTGLGMAMVYGLAKAHRGYVHVASRRGEGTRVEFGIPVADAPAVEEPGPSPPRLRSRASASVTILVVEDELPVRRVAQRALESRGYRVFVAADGEEALALLRGERRVDVLLVDLVMPKLGGRELVRRLQQEGRTFPVVYTSGYSDREVQERSELKAPAAFLNKPWTLEELFSAVERALELGGRRASGSDVG
jgi:PAS domain S-box-containing protein